MSNPGRTAYEALGDALDWTDMHGEQMPEWAELQSERRQAWQMVANAITVRHESELQRRSYDLWRLIHDEKCAHQNTCKSFGGHWKCRFPFDQHLPGPGPVKQSLVKQPPRAETAIKHKQLDDYEQASDIGDRVKHIVERKPSH